MKKKYLFYCFGVTICLMVLVLKNFIVPKESLLIADFNNIKVNVGTPVFSNRGGQYGVWNLDPSDKTQGCIISFSKQDAIDKGGSIHLDYDVKALSPAACGFWMKLLNLDVSNFKKFVFWVKRDVGTKYPNQIYIELKDSRNVSGVIIDEVTSRWQKIEIPLSEFNEINDWRALSEFVIVFSDRVSKDLEGSILIDNITFEK